MYILGISAFYHDSAACLLKNGEIVAAAQEERFTRKKHDADFPVNAIDWCLQRAGITAGASCLVVGRPITQAAARLGAAADILAEISGASGG